MLKSADSASITTVSVRLVDIDESDAADTALNLPIVDGDLHLLELVCELLGFVGTHAVSWGNLYPGEHVPGPIVEFTEGDLAWFRAAVRS